MSKLPTRALPAGVFSGDAGQAKPKLRVRLAHEINNPLSFVLTNAELLLEAEGASGLALSSDERRRMLEEIVDGARRIRDVLQALRPGALPAGSEVAEASWSSPSRAKILAVDDETLLLSALGRLLGQHEITKASSGAEALEAIESSETAGAGFDLVLCDLLMPGMSGMALFAEVERRWPELARRFVFVTGSSEHPGVGAFLATCGRPVLEKPFERRALLSLVSRQLAPEAG